MTPPQVELLWWSGCPSHGKAKAILEAAMRELGLDPSSIKTLQMITDADAVREGFVGSPTIRVNGRDIQMPAGDARPALTCRLYFRRDGRPSPLPDLEDIRSALSRAINPPPP